MSTSDWVMLTLEPSSAPPSTLASRSSGSTPPPRTWSRLSRPLTVVVPLGLASLILSITCGVRSPLCGTIEIDPSGATATLEAGGTVLGSPAPFHVLSVAGFQHARGGELEIPAPRIGLGPVGRLHRDPRIAGDGDVERAAGLHDRAGAPIGIEHILRRRRPRVEPVA